MHPLKSGQRLHCIESRQHCLIQELIGEGGQGEVYRASAAGETCALKWYNELVLRVDRGLRTRLQVAIDMGPPSGHFLWPYELVTDATGRQLGYLMRLRRQGYVKMQALFAQQVRPSFRTLAFAGWQLADALLHLHAKGLVYQDLNAGNIFFDPVSGRVEICDNDNVDIDGAPSVMGGVMEYQAPEVVLRQAGPSRATDLHSLAVMLFRMLHIGHPLIGARELAHPNLTDPAVMRRLYGSEARFVFDPADESNRPLPERHGPVLGHWAIYPRFLRDLFMRAFTAGLHDPQHGRVQETEWRRAMRQLLDSVYSCPSCQAQNFYDPARMAAGQRQFACWHCGVALASAPLRIGLRRHAARAHDAPDHVVVIEPGSRLFAYQLGLDDALPEAEVALVEAHEALVLRNRSGRAWTVGEGSDTRTTAPGQVATVRAGARLNFGRVGGVLRE